MMRFLMLALEFILIGSTVAVSTISIAKAGPELEMLIGLPWSNGPEERCAIIALVVFTMTFGLCKVAAYITNKPITPFTAPDESPEPSN